MQTEQTIKQENKKAALPFAIITIVCTLAGAIIGVMTRIFDGNLQKMGKVIYTFLIDSSSIFLIVTGFVGIIAVYAFYLTASKQARQWSSEEDDEEEGESLTDSINKKLHWSMTINSVELILNFLFFGIALFVEPDSKKAIESMVVVGFFIVFMIFNTVLQQKSVDLLKRLQPEKKGSIYDMNFRRKWEESCDEAELFNIYQSGYQAYIKMNNVYVIVLILSLVGNLAFEWGIASIVMPCLLWLLSTIFYCHAAYKVEFEKRK